MLVALAERRRFGPLPARTVRLAAIAGLFFAGDLMFWHHAIEAVGAGLATVLGNLQVIIVGVRRAGCSSGERPSRATLLALPIVLLGVVLISGVIGSGAYGADPTLGVVLGIATALCYSGYLLVIRVGRSRSRAGRRARSPSRRSSRALGASWSVPSAATSTSTPVPASLFWLAMLGRDGAVARLPADLDLAAAAAGDRDLDHPAGPAGR